MQFHLLGGVFGVFNSVTLSHVYIIQKRGLVMLQLLSVVLYLRLDYCKNYYSTWVSLIYTRLENGDISTLTSMFGQHHIQ